MKIILSLWWFWTNIKSIRWRIVSWMIRLLCPRIVLSSRNRIHRTCKITKYYSFFDLTSLDMLINEIVNNHNFTILALNFPLATYHFMIFFGTSTRIIWSIALLANNNLSFLSYYLFLRSDKLFFLNYLFLFLNLFLLFLLFCLFSFLSLLFLSLFLLLLFSFY